MPALKHDSARAGSREIRGCDEAVVTSTDDDGIVRCRHGWALPSS
jgi:hypothetical protein